MPSGLTHILLMKNVQNDISNIILKNIIASGVHFCQVGAVGPDLPYASILDSSQSGIADLFHKEKTNQIAVKSFPKIKSLRSEIKDDKQFRYMFCFFLGFTSHIVADGIMHPFVRDMVGDYEANKTEHRKLEMRLDVIFLNELTKSSGANLNLKNSDIHKDLKKVFTYENLDLILNVFKELIIEVYGKEETTVEMIRNWIDGLYHMFDIAETDFPHFFKDIPIVGDFLFRDINDLIEKKDQLTKLIKVNGRDKNFLQNTNEIDFIKNCYPQFNKVFRNIAGKAYNYTYKNGAELTANDIYEINLDTGRPVAQYNNLDLIPSFWS
ncbi:MAG: zinc dependent phospholipase C family protein [Melioribacteraceae bacterium]|nr:zinc dependent phospholipase C family protein [Melioribacteraceae bacterium]